MSIIKFGRSCYAYDAKKGQVLNRNGMSGASAVPVADSIRILNNKMADGFLEEKDLSAFKERYPIADRVMFGKMAESTKANLKSLKPKQRKAYKKLFALSQNFVLKRGRLTHYSTLALAKLLDEGTLTKETDSTGMSLIDRLSAMEQNPKIAKGYKRDLICWTLLHIAYPDRCIKQLSGKGTCVAATFNHIVAKKEPAEFVRIVEGLAGPREVELRSGEILKRNPRSLSKKKSGGSPVERMIQASFMDFGNADERYDVKRDSFKLDKKDTGLHATEIETLAKGLNGGEYRTVKPTRYQLEQLLKQDPLVPTCLKWSLDEGDDEDGETEKKEKTKKEPEEVKHNWHMVSTSAIKGGRIEIRNPWGQGAGHLENSETRRVHSEGYESFAADEYFDRLEYVAIPKDYDLGPEKPAVTIAVQPKPKPIPAPILKPKPAPPKPTPPKPEPPKPAPPKRESAHKKIEPKPAPPKKEEPKGIFGSLLGLFGL